MINLFTGLMVVFGVVFVVKMMWGIGSADRAVDDDAVLLDEMWTDDDQDAYEARCSWERGK